MIFNYIICFAAMLVIPYLLCSINTAIIVTKIKSGQDIRTVGSGSAGLTNTLRTQGKAAAFFVLLGDVAKGVVSVLLVNLIFELLLGINCRDLTAGWSWVLYGAGLAAIIGHVFPIYYHFKGGKGVLVTVAVLLAIEWIPAVILLGIFGIIVVISRYVSLGSIIAAICYPFTVLIFGFINNDPAKFLCFAISAAIAAVIVFMHRANIKRLRSHTENKLGQKKENKS